MDTSPAPTLFAPGKGWVTLHEYQNGYPYRPGRAIYLRARDVVLVTEGLTRTSFAGHPLARLRAGDSILATPRRGRWRIRALAGAPALFSNPSGSPKRPAAPLPRGLPARRSRRALRAQRGRSRTP